MRTLLFTESYLLSTIIIIILVLCILYNYKILTYGCLLLLLLLMYFYRFPNRIIKNKDNMNILSPSDGKIVKIIKERDYYKIIVFLSIFDVHIQWYPINGIITHSEYKTGKFNLAYILEKSDYNEKYITEIKNSNGKIRVVQIAGMVARRIVNNSKINKKVKQGDYMGMIKLSSRIDIYLPVNNVKLLVKKGDKIYGNQTKIGEWINK